MAAVTPAEWVSVGSLGLSASALIGLALAFADADPGYFDPRPAVRRALKCGHQAAVHAGHDLDRAIAASQRLTRQALRDAAISLAALLMLCTSSAPEATR